MAYYRLLQVLIIGTVALGIHGQCTIPSAIRDLWISSEKDDLTFNDTYFTGYQVHVFTTDKFTCIEQSGSNYLFKSESFSRFGMTFYAYLCIEFVEIKADHLYKYYKKSVEVADANYERVFFRTTVNPTATAAEACTVTDTSSIRYSLLMKNGSESTVATQCPVPFLGQFSYTFDTGTGNLCTSGSYVDVCTAKTTMTWDYTKCNQIQAYSAGGVTKCIYSTSSGGTSTVHVYNLDATTDQSTTYSFTCYQARGYESVSATQHPGDCPSSMNHTYAPSPGAALRLTASLVCAYDDATTALSAGVIAAIVIIVLLLIAVIIVLIIYYFYHKRKKQRQAEWEALNRKVDPDALSPNMRLGLPDESRYDLDRLMYSPDNMKNGLIKRSRKDGLDGLEGYTDGEKYMDEEQRQTALEAQMYADKRRRKDKKDEFKTAEKTSKVFSDRIKDLAKGRKRPVKMVALAKLRLRPRARPMKGETPGGSDEALRGESRGTRPRDVVIQVEEADGEPSSRRKTRFADEQEAADAADAAHAEKEQKPIKPLEQIETLSDIGDNEHAVADLSDEEKEPRLVLPNLNPKKDKKKRPKDRFSLGKEQPVSSMPPNMRFMPPKSRRKTPNYTEPMPLSRENPTYAGMTPLARIHRRDNPRAWKEAFEGVMNSGTESMDLETLKRQLPENRWKKLLEELYRDKKYFDYVKKSTTTNEKDLFSSADESLQYLYGRALFWEKQEPIPTRPTTTMKRMFSRYEKTRSPSKSIKRSATMAPNSSSKRMPPRTPSTQISRLKKRESMEKKKKQEEKNNRKASHTGLPSFYEGGTQTDFSPVPNMTPVSINDDTNMNDVQVIEYDQQGSPMQEYDRFDTPVIPFHKEVTRSDIRLEEFTQEEDDEYDPEGDEYGPEDGEYGPDDYGYGPDGPYDDNDPNLEYQPNFYPEDEEDDQVIDEERQQDAGGDVRVAV